MFSSLFGSLKPLERKKKKTLVKKGTKNAKRKVLETKSVNSFPRLPLPVPTHPHLVDERKVIRIPEKLLASRFRMINELLYTNSSCSNIKYFGANPQDFRNYHEGFDVQIKKWPHNPILKAIEFLERNEVSEIADFGCGKALLADAVKLTNKLVIVHSFDLANPENNPNIVICNIKRTPLRKSSVDIVFIVLALMGTDWPSFISEAHRVLKTNGYLWIAEVTSRICQSKNKEMLTFPKYIESYGFEREKKKKNNNKNLDKEDSIGTHFSVYIFRKQGNIIPSKIKYPHADILRPCLYKKR